MPTVPAAGGTYALSHPTNNGEEWFFTPTDNAEITIRTTGATGGDTYIDLYESPSFRYVADDDSSGQDGTHARLKTTLKGGVNYVFYTQSYGPAFSYTLHVEVGPPIPPPPAPAYVVANDPFAGAIALPFTTDAATGTVSGGSTTYDNTGATVETGEPAGRQTIWYSFVAPSGPPALLFEATYTGANAWDKPTFNVYTGASVGALTVLPPSTTGNGTNATRDFASYFEAAGVARAVVQNPVAGKQYWVRLSFESGELSGYWTTGTLRHAPLHWSNWTMGDPLLNRICGGRPYHKQTGVVGHYLDGGYRWFKADGSTGGDRPPNDHAVYDTTCDWANDAVFSYPPSDLVIDASLGADYAIRRQGPETGLGSMNSGAVTWPVTLTAYARFGASNTRTFYSPNDSTFPWRCQANAVQSAFRMQLDVRARQILQDTSATGIPAMPDGSPTLGFQFDTSVERVIGAHVSAVMDSATNTIGATQNTSHSLNLEVRAFRPTQLQAANSLLSGADSHNLFRTADGKHAVDNGIANGMHAYELQYNGLKPNGIPTDVEAFSWVRRGQIVEMPLLMQFLNTGATKDARTLTADLMPYRDARHQVMVLINLELHHTNVWPRGPGSKDNEPRGDHDASLKLSSFIDLERRYRVLVETVRTVKPEFDRIRVQHMRGEGRHWRNASVRIGVSDRTGTLEAAQKLRTATRVNPITGVTETVAVSTAKEQRGLRLDITGMLPPNLVWPEPNPTKDRPYTPPP